MRQQQRNIILYVDNAPSHIYQEDKLTNTCVKFFEPNMTAEVQPCDQGIIQNFKGKYTKKFIYRIMARDDAGYDNLHAIDQLEAMRMIHEAWNEVSQDTIKNCWQHAQILPGSTPDDMVADDNGTDKTVDELQVALEELSLSGAVRRKNLLTVDELLHVPGENITEAEWTEEEIVQQVVLEKAAQEGGKDSKDDSEGDDDYEPLMTARAACHALSELEHLCQAQTEHEYSEALPSLHKLSGLLRTQIESKKSQSRISSFFNGA